MDTTATTTIKITSSIKSKQIFLEEFLDLHSLTRAQRSYYIKHNVTSRIRQRTISDWEKRIKIKK